MSNPINDGGRAFPEPFLPDGFDGLRLNIHPGMSLRQHFAGLAMAALIAREDEHIYGHGRIAGLAYALADAMIAEGAAK